MECLTLTQFAAGRASAGANGSDLGANRGKFTNNSQTEPDYGWRSSHALSSAISSGFSRRLGGM